MVAYHEAGHALTGWLLEHADPVMKVSIVPRGKAALGYSQSLPRDVALHTEDQLSDTMVMALGGRAAEEVQFGVVSTGAQNDLERVTSMAYAQVSDFGFSAKVGPLSFKQDGDNTLYKPFSERTARLIDAEAEAIISKAYVRSVTLLREHQAQLEALAEALLEKEVIGSEDLIRILGPRPHSKSVEYDDFINASWKPTSNDAYAPKDEAATSSGDAASGDDDAPGGEAGRDHAGVTMPPARPCRRDHAPGVTMPPA